MADAVVNDHGQLAAAVTDMNIDHIYFGADIELEAPITIPFNKPSLIFDGMYEGVIHRFTDMDSILPTNTLRIGWSSSISLTFQNMIMTGRNYYGIPSIYEVGTSGVTVTYRDITYVGPQLVFNSQGMTHFENVDITISQSTASAASEVGEVCRVEFTGNNIIRHNSTVDGVFWFRGPSGTAVFRLLQNAKLTVDTTHYFMFNTDGLLITYPVAYEIQQGASFTLNSTHGISRGSSHLASSFLVGTNASFRYIQTAVNSYDSSLNSLYITGGFTVNEGASVYMQADFANARPLLYFPSGTGASLTLSNPKSFVLYDSANAPVASALTRSYSIDTEQLNRWTTARTLPNAGGFDDIPQFYWHNANWASFTVSGNITSTTTTATAPELINPQIPITNFMYQNARVLSAGDILIEPDAIIDNGRPITGKTEPNANIIISFTIGGDVHTFDDITAGANGRFELDPKMAIPVGTTISISVNTPFLIKAIERSVVPTGEVTIADAPASVAFITPPVSTDPVLLRRFDPERAVEVDDSRQYPTTQWKLWASISGPLKTKNGEELEVVFKDNDETLWELSGTPIVVHISGPSGGSENVFWTVDKGILVRVPQSIRSGVVYSTQLIWELEVIDES